MYYHSFTVCVCPEGRRKGGPLGTKQRGFPTIISDICQQKVRVFGVRQEDEH